MTGFAMPTNLVVVVPTGLVMAALVSGILALIPALIASKWGRNFLRWWIYSFISIFMILIIAAGVLMIHALRENTVMFYTPSDLSTNQIESGQAVWLGGIVVAGSITQRQDSHVEFSVTDKIKETKVSFQGLLPDLLRDGKCVVALGTLGPAGALDASQIAVVARNTTHFLPPDVVEELKKRKLCQELK